MNATAMVGRLKETSPKSKARLAGGLLLITVVAGGFAQGFIAGSLIVSGDATATATNILAQEPLYRLGFAIYLIEMACQITMTVLFYDLLKPVSKSASILAATFGLIGCTIKTLSRLFFFAPLLVLRGAHYLSIFDPKQLQALALLFLRVNYTAETIAMVFFGLYALVKEYLVFRSTFLPRVLGVLSAVGGLGWLIYLYEPLALRLQSYIVGVGLMGALASGLWLLVKGVNEQRWKEQAHAATASIWR
ncbi:MAG TPA: DUF4386 domain-containing protein [Terriglobales bacterium]